ncbi:histone-lysine N-methyltransferase EHMT1 [Diorhabda carinulata]|uniref:histone-lysine N-methyltransferase EHMT1 n=1 Tax=Diorhabda carinulata TaxID=1163345 RepID=UPI0025A2E263|nr:histone-lysine N-methyltransferase EHMT1 [Diorhabda carinulata]
MMNPITGTENDQYSFINQVLGEMKTEFNKPDEQNEKIKINKDLKELKTEKTVESITVEKNEISPGRRSNRQKIVYEEKQDESTKRSSRRKNSKKSVLQNAIARKVKSYNEPCRPQRLTRQLKPTMKVLENIAQAKDMKKIKIKVIHGDVNDEILKKSKKTKNSDEMVALSQDETINKTSTSQQSASCDSKINITCEEEEISKICSSEISENAELNSRLCLCAQKTNIYPSNDSEDVVYCSAVESIDERLVGCSKEVNVPISPLLRPSRSVPYMRLCNLHKNRMIRHNCCPTCGIFCTQGNFLQCEAKHQFHKKCRLFIGNREYCPHCGISTPCKDISLKFQCSNHPVFLPYQKSVRRTAKISFSKIKDQIRCSTPLLISLESVQPFENTLTNGTIYSEGDVIGAITDDDVETLTSIITSSSLDLNMKLIEFNEGSLLHYAAYKGYLEICHLLISLRVPINDLDKEQNTPLMLAITTHKIDVVQYLVRAGSDITLKGTDGMTALHVSSKCGNLQACKILLETGASIKNYINSQDDGGWTPLVWACENGFSEITDFLISEGADPKLRDVEYNEALHWAAFSGCSHIVELLLNRGCDVNTLNAHGESPLHIAAREDRYNCVVVLIARGADVFSINKNNESPLNCVPDDGTCYGPIALNIQLQSLVKRSLGQYQTIVSDDISKGRESNPVQCVNTVDDNQVPRDYVYITKSIISSEGVDLQTRPSTLQRCKCKERCTEEDCFCNNLSEKCWYDENGKVCIDESFSDIPVIFECSDICSCNAITCRNRVVQKGAQQRFQLYKTDSKGWGIRTLKFIYKGDFVCEYVGEILTDTDADARKDDSFLFDLGNKDTDNFCVDARFYGNLTRFINHSCSPNLRPIKVFVDHQDVRFPRIAFFALRDIPIGEELSFDYGKKFWLAKYKSFTCKCGYPECKYSDGADLMDDNSSCC